jgi:serine/threonine protein kinase
MKQTQLQGTSQSLLGSVLLGRYRIVSELAKGGMGVVYLARSEGAVGFVKPVVIKVLLPEYAQDERVVGMFVREAQILSQLRHASLVDVLEFAEHDGAYLLVLEYVRGHHLGQWLRYLSLKSRNVAPELLIQIVIDVLEALHHAHNQVHPDGSPMQIVHRDVSPSNILLDETGRARLLDFGVARMRGGSQGYRTQVKSFMGKLPYTAPEVFAGRDASPKTDLYACAVVLHEALLGYNVFRSEMQSITLAKVMSHIPELIEPVRRGVPPGLDLVLTKALRKTPLDRHEDAQAFAQALRKLQREPESDLRARLARLLAEDFGAELAKMLNLESLAARDEAWRGFVEQSQSPEARRATGGMLAANSSLPGGVLSGNAPLLGSVAGAPLPDGVAGLGVTPKESPPLAAPTPIGSTAVSGPQRRSTRRTLIQEHAVAADRAGLVAGAAPPDNDNAIAREPRQPGSSAAPAQDTSGSKRVYEAQGVHAAHDEHGFHDAHAEDARGFHDAHTEHDPSDAAVTEARPLSAAKTIWHAAGSPTRVDPEASSLSEALAPSSSAARGEWPDTLGLSAALPDRVARATPERSGVAAMGRTRGDETARRRPSAAALAADLQQPTAAGGAAVLPASNPGASAAVPRSMLIGMWLVGGLAALAIALTLLRLPADPTRALSSVHVVAHMTGNAAVQPQPSAAVPTSEAPAGEGATARDNARPSRSGRAHAATKPPSPQGFTQALRKQQPKLQACFAQHSLSLEGQPVTQLAFDVDENGKPLRVELMPRALGKTSLGQCLLGVARATSFPAQAHPVSFTIPITARRAGG